MKAYKNVAKRLSKALLVLLLLTAGMHGLAQTDTVIYLFPGQGSDYRIFKNIKFPKTTDTLCINYPEPFEGERLPEYAARIAAQIDTDKSHIFLGVSMGGMICSELSEIVPAEKIIIISSAKCRKELPRHYRFQSVVPVNRFVPPKIVKAGALFLQPLVEPAGNKDKACFKSMLSSKTPVYLKRTANMIINWRKNDCSDKIIHIHGDSDNTLPLKNIKADYIIPGGSHMMTLTRAGDLQKILADIW